MAGWQRDQHWAAFADAGMLALATSVDIGGTVYENVYIGLTEPDEIFQETGTQHTHYQAEYQTTALPGLNVGDTITIDSVEYRVKTPPRLQRTGWYSLCDLERVDAAVPKLPIPLTEGASAAAPSANVGGNEYIVRTAAVALGGHRVVRSTGATSVEIGRAHV